MSNSRHKCVSRRCAIALGVKTVPIAVLAASSLSMLQACGKSSSKDSTDTGTNTSGGGTALTLAFAQFPSLEKVGGSIQSKINNTDVYVTRVSEDKIITVSMACTHEQCPVNPYDSGSQQYFCPCHGSIFNADGSVANGPARKPLTTYPSTITKTGVDISG